MTLDEAADRYRAAEVELAEAREWASTLRLATPGFTREARAANQAALDARHALEHARDELVAAALAHTGA